MKSTIKLLETQLILLYISFVCLLIEIIGVPVYAIVMTVITKMAAMLLIALTDIITIIVAIIVKNLIVFTKGSIAEHSKIAEKVESLNKDVALLKLKLNNQQEQTKKIEKAAKEEKIIKEASVQKEEAPNREIGDTIRVKAEKIEIGESIITIDGKIHSIKKVANLGVTGNELRFSIDGTEYIVECLHYSDSSKMYNEIYFHL